MPALIKENGLYSNLGGDGLFFLVVVTLKYLLEYEIMPENTLKLYFILNGKLYREGSSVNREGNSRGLKPKHKQSWKAQVSSHPYQGDAHHQVLLTAALRPGF